MDYKGASILICPSGSCSKLIYLVGMGYEGWIGSRFIFVHKGVLIIMQGCKGVSEQGLWIGLIDKLVGLIGLINQSQPILSLD